MQILIGIARLKKSCPRWAANLKGIAIDNGCNILRMIRAKLAKIDQNSPGFDFYTWLNTTVRLSVRPAHACTAATAHATTMATFVRRPVSLTAFPVPHLCCQVQIFVDEWHFKNHSLSDQFCQDECNPAKYPEITAKTNHEAAEQTNRWAARFKLIVNHSSLAKGTFFLSEMKEVHNHRVLRSEVMSVDSMPAPRFAEVNAAYGRPPVADSTTERALLVAHLLSPQRARQPWSQDLLDAHRSKVGGDWRTLHKRSSRVRSRAQRSGLSAFGQVPGK